VFVHALTMLLHIPVSFPLTASPSPSDLVAFWPIGASAVTFLRPFRFPPKKQAFLALLTNTGVLGGCSSLKFCQRGVYEGYFICQHAKRYEIDTTPTGGVREKDAVGLIVVSW